MQSQPSAEHINSRAAVGALACRNLGELFAQDPELAKKRGEGGKVPRSLLFAGSRLDDEFELRKLQVSCAQLVEQPRQLGIVFGSTGPAVAL